MMRWRKGLLARLVLIAALASLAACAGMSDNETSPSGYKPGGTLDNGLTPEPWGETS
jgi:hypothetical protein